MSDSATKVGAKSIPSPASASSRSTTTAAKSTDGTSDGNSSAATLESKTHISDAAQNGEAANGDLRTHQERAASNGKGATVDSQTQRSDAPYAFLALAAETLEDIERVRIAAENRARALTHPEQRICLSPDDPHVTMADAIATELAATEHQAELALKRVLRQTPLGDWVKKTVGIGEKQAGRLLGVIGDPRVRIDGETGEVHERTVGQLWSYCGYAVVPADHARPEAHAGNVGVAPHRRKGEQSKWNTKARMRTYLIAESCMKSPTSPYRAIYEQGREKYANAKHAAPCAQCGTKGKPAQPGTDLRDGHKHARALRLVAKAVLKDLWIAAGH